jgi:hypothetical protein
VCKLLYTCLLDRGFQGPSKEQVELLAYRTDDPKKPLSHKHVQLCEPAEGYFPASITVWSP